MDERDSFDWSFWSDCSASESELLAGTEAARGFDYRHLGLCWVPCTFLPRVASFFSSVVPSGRENTMSYPGLFFITTLQEKSFSLEMDIKQVCVFLIRELASSIMRHFIKIY